MKYCKNCGREVNDDDKFCPYCGASLDEQQEIVDKKTNNNSTVSFVKPRNLALALVLSIITCGFYTIYWQIKLTDEANEVFPTDYKTSGVATWLFSLITCGIFGFYWAYKMGQKVISKSNNPNDNYTPIIYLVLYFFVGIVVLCLLQDSVNKEVE